MDKDGVGFFVYDKAEKLGILGVFQALTTKS